TSEPMRNAIQFLLNEQEKNGSWFGRWGVNYIYGTWSALTALGAAGLPQDHISIKAAISWLLAIQNEDGGWGESCASYEAGYAGHQKTKSTASQTAWATLGLISVG